MITVKDLMDAYESNREVRIVCTDGQIIIGMLSSVDDEEESGLGEMGLSVFTRDGGYVGIGESEIKRIELLD